jgi:tryptophan synthase beta chain
VTDEDALKASFEVAKLEGIIPALETGHAFSALHQLELRKEDNIVICLSGRGDKDLATYMRVME